MPVTITANFPEEASSVHGERGLLWVPILSADHEHMGHVEYVVTNIGSTTTRKTFWTEFDLKTSRLGPHTGRFIIYFIGK